MRILKGIALATAPLWSHHVTSAEFDVSRLIVLQGTVREVEWINPHAWLHLEVKSADGKTTVWRIEGASVSSYESRKFPRESVTPGMEISMTAYPAKSGEAMADGATITFADGKRIFFGGSGPIDGLDSQGRPCLPSQSKDCRRNPSDSK